MRPKENFSNLYPKNTKTYHQSNYSIKTTLTSRTQHPGDKIFYFASKPSRTGLLLPRKEAYDRLQNSGISEVNSENIAYIYLKKPSIYKNPEDGSVYPPHYHYVLWSTYQKCWGKKVYTVDLCMV
uniref:Uncharacterized protein n=1 Tax=viral metagenome TaxID=1070528 RepID=A0A6C0KTG1_9ZZZZ